MRTIVTRLEGCEAASTVERSGSIGARPPVSEQVRRFVHRPEHDSSGGHALHDGHRRVGREDEEHLVGEAEHAGQHRVDKAAVRHSHDSPAWQQLEEFVQHRFGTPSKCVVIERRHEIAVAPFRERQPGFQWCLDASVADRASQATGAVGSRRPRPFMETHGFAQGASASRSQRACSHRAQERHHFVSSESSAERCGIDEPENGVHRRTLVRSGDGCRALCADYVDPDVDV